MDFQLTVGGGVPLTPVVYCSRANRTFHSRTQAPGRKGMLFPRQRPGDRIWLLLFFYSAYLISAVRGAVFLLTHLP